MWSPDGMEIIFVSDRKNYVNTQNIPTDFTMYEFDYHQTDIYLINSDGSDIRRITETEQNEDYPVWGPEGKSLFYIS